MKGINEQLALDSSPPIVNRHLETNILISSVVQNDIREIEGPKSHSYRLNQSKMNLCNFSKTVYGTVKGGDYRQSSFFFFIKTVLGLVYHRGSVPIPKSDTYLLKVRVCQYGFAQPTELPDK